MDSVMAVVLLARPQSDEVERFVASKLQRYLAQMLAQDVGL